MGLPPATPLSLPNYQILKDPPYIHIRIRGFEKNVTNPRVSWWYWYVSWPAEQLWTFHETSRTLTSGPTWRKTSTRRRTTTRLIQRRRAEILSCRLRITRTDAQNSIIHLHCQLERNLFFLQFIEFKSFSFNSICSIYTPFYRHHSTPSLTYLSPSASLCEFVFYPLFLLHGPTPKPTKIPISLSSHLNFFVD